MGQHFKRAASLTSSAPSMDSSTASKSSSPSSEDLARFNSRLSMNGVKRELSPVSWKRLRKRSPWLKLLKPHQIKGVEVASFTSGFALLFAQRTGKTWVTGAILEVEREETYDVLLSGLKTNLKSTWGKFFSEKLPYYRVFHSLEEYDNDKKKDKQPNIHRVLLLNPEQLTKVRDKLRRRRFHRFVWDEAQRTKNRTSQSSKDAAYIARGCSRVLALTGTPMDADPKDLWALMRFIAPEVLGDAWKDFAEHFLVEPHLDLKKKGVVARQREMLRYQIAKRKAPMRLDRLDEYAELLSPHIMRVSKKDAGIKSAKIKTIEFDLAPHEAELYRQLEKTMVMKTKKLKVKTPLKITQIGKLQQITGGHIKDEEGETHEIGTTKRRELRKAINLHRRKREPFVVFCKFVWEVHMIAALLKRGGFGKGKKLYGKIKDIKTDPRRTNILLNFQKGKYDWMVCQQKTGGVGVDLYRSRRFFVYSMGHSYIDFDQMISRGDFIEQKERAKFFLLAVKSSIDTDIIDSVKRKKSITERFYDRLSK